MQDLKEIIKIKKEEVEQIDNKRYDLNREIEKLELEQIKNFKTLELIDFLNTITQNRCVIKDCDSFIILNKYEFYIKYVYLKGESVEFNEGGIEYRTSDSKGFNLSEDTIEEITKTLLKFENQEFIKKVLKDYKSFYEKINNGEIE